jgi:hypothetical protein
VYFPGCSAGDCGFTTAFFNVVADGFAVVALVTEHRVATRYDKLIESFAAFVLLACIRILRRSN